MAEATVTVGSRTGAIPEVVAHDDLLFDEDNYHQLAAILERLAANEVELAGHQHRLWLRTGEFYTNKSLAARRMDFLKKIRVGANLAELAQGHMHENA
jgi:glycosyltransferase involved in cell wall biosynthesis